MAVEKVFTPQSIKQGNPKEAKEQKSVEEGDNTNWPAMAKDAKGMLDYANTQRLLNQIANPGGGESGLKVEGKVNLGDFNLQEQANAAAAQAEQIRQDKDAEVRTERERREAAETKLQEERIASIRTDMNNKMTELQQSIQKMMEGTNQKGERAILSEFMENFTTVKGMIAELSPIASAEAADSNVQLELAKISMTQAREEREFKRQMKVDDRHWQIEMQKLQDQRDHNSGVLMLQKQRNDMLANLPKQIGGALASAVASQEAGIQSAAAQPPQGWQLSVEEGGGGEFECPHCAQQGKIVKVAVAPSTTMAVCASCRNTFPIKRKPAGQTEQTEQTPEEEQ